MGKAARWFRNLLGLKKEKEQLQYVENSNALPIDKNEKRRKSFAKSGKDTCSQGKVSCDLPVYKSLNDSNGKKCYSADTEKDRNKHAIAVAAATAAAADAAVAAAQAAVAVVRLTSNGRGTLFNGGREKLAALKIQAVFRGYLARKALRALRALVKLQALVRGYLVRKRAAETLYSMHVLIRAQTAVRTQRARQSFSKECRIHPEIRGRRSIEVFDDRRNMFHSKRISTSSESPYSAFDESPKTVEIDTINPWSRTRRINSAISECGENLSYQGSSSPLPCPRRIAIPECNQYQDFEWSFTGDECRFSTAQNTPRFANYVRSNAPSTPSKSVGGDSYFKPCSNHPNYMSNTQSFKAKLRSLSAPKQRPGPGTKKRLSLTEMMAARNSISGVRVQKYPTSRFEETRIYEM